MRRIMAAAGAVVLLAAAQASCGDITEPDPAVELRIAHAAPGLGVATVLMDSLPELQLAATQSAFFPIPQRPVFYQFVIGTDTAELQVSHEADINGVILMDRDDPTLRYFQLERSLDGVRLMAINGDFLTHEDMTIRIAATDTTFEETVAPGQHFLIEPEPGSFTLQVRGGGSDQFVNLAPFPLIQHDHGFLIVLPVPGTEPGSAYTRMLF